MRMHKQQSLVHMDMHKKTKCVFIKPKVEILTEYKLTVMEASVAI